MARALGAGPYAVPQFASWRSFCGGWVLAEERRAERRRGLLVHALGDV